MNKELMADDIAHALGRHTAQVMKSSFFSSMVMLLSKVINSG